MYTFIALLFIAIYLITTIIIPFRFADWPQSIFKRLEGLLYEPPDHTSYRLQSCNDRQSLKWIRIWGGTAAGLFAIFGLIDGAVIRNQPQSVAAVGAYGILSLGISGLVFTSSLAFGAYLPRARGYRALHQCGFQSLAMVDCLSPSKAWRESLGARIRSSQRIGIVEVTGFELLGKGAGPTGGLLYDALDAARNVPVFVLLLKPESQAPDPEGKKATVYQGLLTEMNITPSNYLRKVRMTLEAIAALNENRPDEARIRVRYYNEIPSMRAVVFEDAALLIPWQPREAIQQLPILELARKAEAPTLYETFRRQLVRLWSASSPEAGSETNGSGSKAIKSKSISVRVMA